MLQSINIKSHNPKALEGAKGSKAAEGESNLLTGEEINGGDFASELMSQISAVDLEVKPVIPSPEQTLPNPSALIDFPEQVETEIGNPKVFDPALTQDVENLIQPKTTGVDLEILKNGQVEAVQELDPELTQALLKTPQIVSGQAGRSPAIDLAASEVDPQLMNMDDFVAQKNLATKKQMNNAAYGMKPQMQKMQIESGLNSTQVVKEAGAVDASGGQSQSINSQQFILGMMSEQPVSAKVNEVQAPVKVFDMSQIKTENPNQIMNQVTDYIVQAKAAKEPTVNMRVNHDELGMIDITVQKTSLQSHAQGAVAINIGTHSVDGKNFFQANSKELFSHLAQAGINVSDLRVETPSQTAKNDFDMSHQRGGSHSSGHDKQFGSEQNQRRHESERRQDLWNLLKDKEAA